MSTDAILNRLDEDAADCKLIFGEGSDVHRAAQLLYRVALAAVIDSERVIPSDVEEFRAAYARQQACDARAMNKERGLNGI